MTEHLHSTFWEEDEAPAMRRYRLWERSNYGASVTLGKTPPPPSRRRIYTAAEPPPPPPLTSIPAETPDNCLAIIAEVFAHHRLAPPAIQRRAGLRATACAHELAYRLALYGRRNGRSLNYVEIGKLLHRHRDSVRYGIDAHQRRIDAEAGGE